MKKRCLSLLLATILCICMMPAALAAGTEIAVVPSSQTAAVGDTVTVTVEIKGNPGVAAVQFALTYDDSVMKCTGVSTGPALKGALSAVNPNASDGAIVAAASASELTEDGVLATFTFRVVGTAPTSAAVRVMLLPVLPLTVVGLPWGPWGPSGP